MDTLDNKNDKLREQLKDLDDTEFEIIFIDVVCKKLKSLDRPGIKIATLLFLYMSVVDSIKKYKELAKEFNRTIPHEEIVDLIITKGEAFLTKVANDTNEDVYASAAAYTAQEVVNMHELVKELMLVLKKELVNTDKYSYLRDGCNYL